jgi:Raf kinase inhibitor-like YbhB/YbcL family protein
MGKLTLRSPVFNNMGEIPKKYTCQGEEINPPLTISGVSQEVKSLILIMEDPDAPIGTVTHWIICHLDPGTTKIPEACSLDGAIVGKNMMRKNKYMGPCPPKGKHRYFFKLYAVDEKLPLDSKSRKKKVLKAMEGHIIEQTELIGTYIKH